MLVVGIAFALCIEAVLGGGGAAPHHSLACPSCPWLLKISDCTVQSKCHPDEVCGTEVHDVNGQIVYAVNCQKIQDCQHWHPLHHAHFPHNTLVDYNCCDTPGCNLNYGVTTSTSAPSIQTTESTTPIPQMTTTAAVSTTADPSAHPITAQQQPISSVANTGYDPVCFDSEEDGVQCATLDLFGLCTDTSTFGYVLAHKKCPRHCKICTPTVMATKAPAPVPSGATCEDHEQDGIKCLFMDLYGFCTDPNMLAYTISHIKCKKHCGFCTTGSGK